MTAEEFEVNIAGPLTLALSPLRGARGFIFTLSQHRLTAMLPFPPWRGGGLKLLPALAKCYNRPTLIRFLFLPGPYAQHIRPTPP